MIDVSLTTFLRHEFQRIVDWQTESPPSVDDVDEAVTIGDCIESYDIAGRLPEGWHVERDIVQFGDESPVEVIRLTDSGDGYRITLKPVKMEAPTETVEIYTRRSPFESRQHRTTVDSLSTAVTAAKRITTDREATSGTDSRPRQTAIAPTLNQ